MNPEQQSWIGNMQVAAAEAGHPFPAMAACEAAEESDFGRSLVATQFKNLFGTKRQIHEQYPSVCLPVREVLDGWKIHRDEWERYETFRDCFHDRLNTLIRLRQFYPHYAAALDTKDQFIYLNEVSEFWHQPDRAARVHQIFSDYTLA